MSKIKFQMYVYYSFFPEKVAGMKLLVTTPATGEPPGVVSKVYDYF